METLQTDAVKETAVADIRVRINDLCNRMVTTNTRLSAVADKAFGNEPEGAQGANNAPSRAGELGGIVDDLDSLSRLLSQLEDTVIRFQYLA